MQKNEIERTPADMLPLNPIVFNILSVLGGNVMHGYEIKKKVEADMSKAVPTATLYRHLRTMRDDRLLEEVTKYIDNDDPRRQYFKLTAFGQLVYAAEYNRLGTVRRNPFGLFGESQTVPAGGG